MMNAERCGHDCMIRVDSLWSTEESAQIRGMLHGEQREESVGCREDCQEGGRKRKNLQVSDHAKEDPSFSLARFM